MLSTQHEQKLGSAGLESTWIDLIKKYGKTAASMVLMLIGLGWIPDPTGVITQICQEIGATVVHSRFGLLMLLHIAGVAIGIVFGLIVALASRNVER